MEFYVGKKYLTIAILFHILNSNFIDVWTETVLSAVICVILLQTLEDAPLSSRGAVFNIIREEEK